MEYSKDKRGRRAVNSQGLLITWSGLIVVGIVAVVRYGGAALDVADGLAGFSAGGLIVLGILAGGVLVLIARPVVTGEEAVARPDTPAVYGTARQNRVLELLYAEKNRLLRAIRDLDFDYDLGKLVAATYAEQRVLLIRQAAAILARIDELEDEINAQQGRVEAALAVFRQGYSGLESNERDR